MKMPDQLEELETTKILDTTNSEYGITLKAYKNGKTVTIRITTGQIIKDIAQGGFYKVLGTLPERLQTFRNTNTTSTNINRK